MQNVLAFLAIHKSPLHHRNTLNGITSHRFVRTMQTQIYVYVLLCGENICITAVFGDSPELVTLRKICVKKHSHPVTSEYSIVQKGTNYDRFEVQ